MRRNHRARSREESNTLRKTFYERFDRGELSLQEAAKLMRELFGMTQADFAAHRGVSVRTIQDLEQGRRRPSVESLNRIVSIFGLEALPVAEGAHRLARKPREVVVSSHRRMHGPETKPMTRLRRKQHAPDLDGLQPVHRYPLNIHGRDFAVGDVHGCFSMLDAELAARGFDPARDRLFSVGDLVDRGAESAAVLDAVQRHAIKAVRGNHEQGILDWALRDNIDLSRVQAMRDNPDQALANWSYVDSRTSELVCNGGEWFIELYCAEDSPVKAHDIVSYFSVLPYAIEVETAHGLVGIVHAEVPCDQWSEVTHTLQTRRSSQVRETVLWDRSRWTGGLIPERIEGVSAVIVGHTPHHEIRLRGNVIDIDTGAVYRYLGNGLTVLDLADIPDCLSERCPGRPAERS
ncbi:metallophosphoesterase [Paraburkholderia tagetis]|uniref:Helix-turn-helix domain-containing protein n=1 Tax=Paraburkholderia tagetis TaxID=2913261 RepID=A0A9X1UNV8_9BURK|nr:metallophosphoesterase [Paraburkholderia tagetis]MCG5078908.1 helix-turn-helix domain-containing protein [Paraburkholderia tagetis]